MRNKYQSKDHKSNPKFGAVREHALLVRVPLPMAEVWSELQAQVEELTGQAESDLGIGPILAPAVCAGGSNRVM